MCFGGEAQWHGRSNGLFGRRGGCGINFKELIDNLNISYIRFINR